MPPEVSIVMPAYNAERWIAEAIASVRAQTFPDWELIVVDDGSADRSAAIAETCEDGRIRVIRQSNQGQSATQNRGLDASRGAFVLLLDADDRLRPHALAHLHAALAAAPDAALAYGSAVYMAEDGSPLPKVRGFSLARRPSGDVLRAILKRNFIWNAGTVLIRSAPLRSVGGLRTDLVLSQDWELWCRLAAANRFRYAGPPAVLDYRVHGSSVARTTGSDPANQRAAVQAVFGNPSVRRRLTPQVLRGLERARWAEASLYAAVELVRENRLGEARGRLREALTLNPLLLRAALLRAGLLLPVIPRFVRTHLGISSP